MISSVISWSGVGVCEKLKDSKEGHNKKKKEKKKKEEKEKKRKRKREREENRGKKKRKSTSVLVWRYVFNRSTANTIIKTNHNGSRCDWISDSINFLNSINGGGFISTTYISFKDASTHTSCHKVGTKISNLSVSVCVIYEDSLCWVSLDEIHVTTWFSTIPQKSK